VLLVILCGSQTVWSEKRSDDRGRQLGHPLQGIQPMPDQEPLNHGLEAQ